MPSSTASSTPRTALPSTARPCANHRKNPPSVESLTLTPPSEPLNLSMGATVRDHRNAVRDRSESLSAIDRNHCPHSPESASFSGVKADQTLLDEQRQHKLYQERYFKMEYELVSAARDTGLSASANLIGTNLCHYAYVAHGRVGMTQSYVAVSGEIPKPAAFRKQLAEMAEFKRVLRLPLSDEPFELVTPKSVFGILLHSPVGRRFTAEDQTLGALGFFIPYEDCSGWAAQF